MRAIPRISTVLCAALLFCAGAFGQTPPVGYSLVQKFYSYNGVNVGVLRNSIALIVTNQIDGNATNIRPTIISGSIQGTNNALCQNAGYSDSMVVSGGGVYDSGAAINAGYTAQVFQCLQLINCATPVPDLPLVGSVVNSGPVTSADGYNLPPTEVCASGCIVDISYSGLGAKIVQGKFNYFLRVSTVSQRTTTCTAGVDRPAVPTATASLPPDTCPQGQTLGSIGFSGGLQKKVCVNSATGTPVNPYAPKTGTSTTTAVTNSDGTKTTTTTETGSDGSTKTTNTTTNADGTPKSATTSSTEPTQEKKNEQQKFCEDNPNSPMCKISVVSSSCAATTCDGDAVSCAIQKRAQEISCALTVDSGTQGIADAVAGGTDTGQTGNPALAANREIFSLPSSISQTRFLSPGAGLADLVITVQGQVIPIPFSKANPYLDILGNICVAFAMLYAARLIFKA